ncbi:DUF1653 domain-containing protein [Alicyclobacillus dauci]|uniref:DUF1653 domain-containing protein n=1 Tax=Alicyclobacillus dauci TaxID=1475485 RepID=A0ABY6Z7Q7_9BACL|nr:DUF1653 domain-containing protein [Alicyclobacillus dauci]WAH38279.1 DUF1653 domain-containing protein [Alicyclobacillus dauci]
MQRNRTSIIIRLNHRFSINQILKSDKGAHSNMTPEERIQSLHPGQQFKHYKGGIYTYIHMARHCETEEWFVIYETSHGDVWIRPYDMFFETVMIDGKQVPRFKEL